MGDRIIVRGIRALGIHGVLAEEQVRPQPFEIDVELSVDLRAAGSSDDLADTVDYGLLTGAVARVVTNERHQLLERMAERVAEVCRQDNRVTGVTVTVRKLHPPIDVLVDHVAVQVHR